MASRVSGVDTELLSPDRRVVMLPVRLLLSVVMLPAKVVDDIAAIRMHAHNRDGADLMTFLLVNRTFTGLVG